MRGQLKLAVVNSTVAIFSSFILLTAAQARAGEPIEQPFDISPQSLATGLSEFARQSRQEILFSPEVVAAKRSHAVRGNLKPLAALQILLQDSGLKFTTTPGGAILVGALLTSGTNSDASEAQAGGTSEEDERAWGIAQAADASASETAATAQGGARRNDKEQTDVPQLQKQELEEVVVTGSHIITDPGKLTRQILTITREELENSGFTRLDEYLRTLPQNVNAATNVGAGALEAGGVTFGRSGNVYAGSGINLRGLGEQYTLVLIDGRRPARGGLFGDVFDISTIPLARVERIEILFDGAAALYGADAVGGVVNIITRRDYEGTQLGVTLNRPEDGGGEELSFDAGHTFSWGEGSMTVSGSYQTRKPIDGGERAIPFAPFPADGNGFIVAADGGLTLHPSVPGNLGTGFGNDSVLMWVRDVDGDGRTTNQALDERLSGGVLVQDEESGQSISQGREPPPGYVPVYTAQLPQSFAGAQLSLYDIPEIATASLPSATDSQAQILQAMRARFPLGASTYVPGQGYSLVPKDDTTSVAVSFQQRFTERLRAELSVGYSRSERDSSTRNDVHQQIVSALSPANPFGVSTFFNFSDDLPQTLQRIKVDTASANAEVDFTVGGTWTALFSAGLSESKSTSDEQNDINIDELGRAVGGFDINDAGEVVSNGLGFTRSLLGYPDAAAYLAALTIASAHTRTDTSSFDADVRVSGVLARLPAGEARTSIVVARRRTTTDVYSEQFDDRVFDEAVFEPGVQISSRTSRGETGVGMELSVPLLKPLLANANGRYERYDGIEDRALNWSSGLNWTLTDAVTARVNFTHNVMLPPSALFGAGTRLMPTIFRVVDESREPLPVDELDPLSGLQTAYWILGSNRSVVPEESDTLSFGFIFQPLEGLDVDVNFADSSVDGQIGFANADERYTPSELTPAAIAANPLLDRVQGGSVTIDGVTYTETTLTESRGAPRPLINGALVMDHREYNVGDVDSRSADLNLRYRWSTRYGQWILRYGHQYVFEYELTTQPICLENVCQQPEDVGIPVDVAGVSVPLHQGSLNLSWESHGLSAHLQTFVSSELEVDQEEGRLVERDGEFVELKNRYRVTTRPGTAVHMGVGYDFSGDLIDVPAWLRSTQLNVHVNNLFYSKQKLTRRVIEQQFEPSEFRENAQFLPYGVDPYGRQFQLEFRTSF